MTSKTVEAIGSMFVVAALLAGCQGLADPQGIDDPNHLIVLEPVTVTVEPYEPDDLPPLPEWTSPGLVESELSRFSFLIFHWAEIAEC